MRGFSWHFWLAVFSSIALAACTYPSAILQPIPDGHSASPSFDTLPLYPFTLDYLGQDSPQVTRTISLKQKVILETITANSPRVGVFPGISLSADPATGILTLHGPLIPVTALTELLWALDRVPLEPHTLPLNHVDPLTAASILNGLFLLGDDVENVLYAGPLTIPTKDSIIVLAWPEIMPKVETALHSVDVDPPVNPSYGPQTKVPLVLKEASMVDVLDFMSRTLGIIAINPPPLSSGLTVNTPSVDRQEALKIFRAAYGTQGYRIKTYTTSEAHPRTFLLLTPWSEGKQPPTIHLGADPEKLRDSGIQVIPLAHLSVVSDAVAINATLHPLVSHDDNVSVRPHSNCYVVSGSTTNTRRIMELLAQLDRGAVTQNSP